MKLNRCNWYQQLNIGAAQHWILGGGSLTNGQVCNCHYILSITGTLVLQHSSLGLALNEPTGLF